MELVTFQHFFRGKEAKKKNFFKISGDVFLAIKKKANIQHWFLAFFKSIVFIRFFF